MNSEIATIMLYTTLQGLIYSLVVLAVFITSRIIKFDDLTTEGSVGLGGAMGAAVMLHGGHWCHALCFAAVGGAIAGLTTGLLHTKLKINNLICGLVVTTGLFSICLKCAGANLALPGDAVHVDLVWVLFGVALLVFLIYSLIQRLLASEIGLLLKVAGNNPQMLTSLGKNVDGYKIGAIALANALTALAGCLITVWNGYFSITANIGTLVIGLAGLIIGEVLFRKALFGLIVGGIVYQAIFAVTIELELEPVWNNLIKAVLIVLLIQMQPKGESHVAVR